MKKHSIFNWIWLIRKNFNGYFTSSEVPDTSDVVDPKKLFPYSPANASAATSSEDYSADDHPLIGVKKKLLSEDNQQELTKIRNMLQQILLFETEFQEWIERDDDLLPPHSDDSVLKDETGIGETKVKHEEAITSFNMYKMR
ncbi:hypothetical protein QE152_g40602 [Popillia japonica]|uniref:Uncharacterized protein n=1 Tax=Popillia japonica TaxID=7064 RepID=A0AAW1HFP7_POPJA